jgi:hypothetical protein
LDAGLEAVMWAAVFLDDKPKQLSNFDVITNAFARWQAALASWVTSAVILAMEG